MSLLFSLGNAGCLVCYINPFFFSFFFNLPSILIRYRPLCSLLIAQGLIIHKARKINDGQIKRAFVQAYFVCFFLATIGLILEHTYYNKAGVVDGRFFGTIKIILMIGLTIGYAWFCFFQPPSVFQGLANYNRYQQ